MAVYTWSETMRIKSELDFHRLAQAIRLALAAKRGYLRLNPQAFEVAAECAAALIEWLTELAKRENLRIEIVDRTGTRVAVLTAGSVLVGIGAGALLAGFPGAVLGAGAGLLAGYGLAHVTVVWGGPDSFLLHA
jgi:hypothetical protein